MPFLSLNRQTRHTIHSRFLPRHATVMPFESLDRQTRNATIPVLASRVLAWKPRHVD
jgi:hypothetical protein